MVQIVGKYQYVSNENFEEFMKALGHAELVLPFMQAKPMVDIQKSGDQWTITVNSGDHSSTSTFKMNEPYEERLPASDRKYQSLTVVEGNNFKTETQVSDGLKITRLYEFTDSGMKVYLSMNKGDLKATRTYKRL